MIVPREYDCRDSGRHMTDEQAAAFKTALEPFYDVLSRSVVGLRPLIDRIVIGLLTGGHVLVEGVPGLAKTLAVRSVAAALSLRFSRIQFTPDLLPSDLVGAQVLNPKSAEFSVRMGPVFANIVLADEINRAPAKVQSALLEAMQELQVTIADTTYPLSDPFFVLATQNPIEHEGTYPLPEAQLDRFLFKVKVEYPSAEDETRIVDRMAAPSPAARLTPVLTAGEIAELRRGADGVHLDPRIRDYAVAIVRATRPPASGPAVAYGAGPRASVGLVRAARAYALLQGRSYVVPHDIKALAPDVLRHRLVLSYDAEADGLDADAVIARILAAVPAP